MMNYNEFKEELVEAVKEVLGKKARVEVEQMKKINKNDREGLVVSEVGKNISPILYIDELYSIYKSENCFHEIVALVVGECKKIPHIEGMEMLDDWKQVKTHVKLELINQEWNELLLKEVPFETIEDLAVICRIEFFQSKEGKGGCIVNNDMLNSWNISKEELFRSAHENLKEEGFYIIDLNTAIKEMTGKDMAMELGIEEEIPQQYVLTNKSKWKGACGILQTELLQDFSNQIGKNFFILPSSVHELIFVPDDKRLQTEELQEMVLQVNDTCVTNEERLSDHVYYYDRTKEKIEMVA